LFGGGVNGGKYSDGIAVLLQRYSIERGYLRVPTVDAMSRCGAGVVRGARRKCWSRAKYANVTFFCSNVSCFSC
jgi:hypothetical protein